MEWFSLAQQVRATESALHGRVGAPRLDLLVTLAWQLRQRDCHRALLWAAEAESLISESDWL